MKKIITLLFCSALITSALAQTNHRHKRNDNRYNNNCIVYQNSNARRDQVIQKINAHYEYKIQQVSHDRYMKRREKKRAIKMLQSQKADRSNGFMPGTIAGMFMATTGMMNTKETGEIVIMSTITGNT